MEGTPDNEGGVGAWVVTYYGSLHIIVVNQEPMMDVTEFSRFSGFDPDKIRKHAKIGLLQLIRETERSSGLRKFRKATVQDPNHE